MEYVLFSNEIVPGQSIWLPTKDATMHQWQDGVFELQGKVYSLSSDLKRHTVQCALINEAL